DGGRGAAIGEPRMRRIGILCATVLLVSGMSCGKSNKVGSDELTNFTEGTTSTRLGQTASTAPPETTTTAKGAPTSQGTTTTAKQQPFNTIEINLDSPHFRPPVAEAVQGRIIAWKNVDSTDRGVESNDAGLFASPPIKPGATWEWTVPKSLPPGNYNYHDSTRPYAGGTLSVAASR
ncbi:MAG: hypothetical protein LC792_19225, partial [Actinobacteria bacterium]|nr:hypothetical protein [Actinomycetota bacterium]